MSTGIAFNFTKTSISETPVNSPISLHRIHDPGTEPPGGAEEAGQPDRTLVIIDNRALERECFAQSLIARGVGLEVLAVGRIEEYTARRDEVPPVCAILLNLGGRRVGDAQVEDEIRRLSAEFGKIPLIVLADTDELPQILQALEYGVRGFIPTSVGIGDCIEAIGLAMAGGVFVPASSVIAMRRLVESRPETQPLSGMFTLRQAEVVEALRRGKANKIIAYELNLRESTVKVHIRNIMRKLKATNRTEVAFKINHMFPGYAQAGGSHATHPR
ncbi:response regulator transcription factor [Aquamicrobium lusatiense]|uniref:response regulator transcription factor n=1 Tax=Aquamicrobium lusatiense TaxID=89772 RepID=UPI0024557DF2|nr:response regulator transcription factor [Aquamicrobium lusatiense]MDH4989444.1 response regulator transcription factor [Aquamicrobium lusatiense]